MVIRFWPRAHASSGESATIDQFPVIPAGPAQGAQPNLAVPLDVTAMYEFVKKLRPLEPINLTRDQWEWIRPHAVNRSGHRLYAAPLWGTPVRIVDDVAESTPAVKGWTGWPGCPAPNPVVAWLETQLAEEPTWGEGHPFLLHLIRLAKEQAQ